MQKLRRALFSQNFLHNRGLVNRLIRSSSIAKNDLVVEFGPGKGIITEFLLAQSQHVLAVEIDSKYCQFIRSKFNNNPNLTIYNQDCLSYTLPQLPYKVFANIPFSIEGKVVRQLIDGPNPPEDCYLVIMSELAYRLSAPHKENQFSLMHKPWFRFSIEHKFQRSDFSPYSNTNSVLFRFQKLKTPLLPISEKEKYQYFIKIGFGQGLNLFRNLSRYYGKERARLILNSSGIKMLAHPTELDLDKWIDLYINAFRTIQNRG